MQTVLTVLVLVCWVAPSSAGLLGAGEGDGSCGAPPFRAERESLAWPEGCPGWAPCCTEYGYCHSKTSWEQKLFRDCNGESNGIELPADTLLAEAEAAGEELEVLAQQQEEVEVPVAAPPLPVIDNSITDYEAPPLTGLYQAPGN